MMMYVMIMIVKKDLSLLVKRNYNVDINALGLMEKEIALLVLIRNAHNLKGNMDKIKMNIVLYAILKD